MRILHRYVLASFATDFLVAAFLFTGLVTLGDTALKLDEFLEDATATVFVSRLVTYALALLPVLFIHLAPVLTLAAAMLTLSSLGRSRELVAMRSVGISPLGITLPIFIAALVISSALFVVGELYLPKRADQIMSALSLAKGPSAEKLRRLAVDGRGTAFYFQRFAPADGLVEGVWIDFKDPETRVWSGSIQASWGSWRRQAGEDVLVLRDVVHDHPDGSRHLADEVVIDTDLRPADVDDPGARLAFESIATLLERVRAGSGQRDKLALEVHSRIAQYFFTSWVLLLLTLPLVIRVEELGRWRTIALAVGAVGAFMAVHQLSYSLGLRGHLPPEVAAWFPVALFGALGVCLFSDAQS